MKKRDFPNDKAKAQNLHQLLEQERDADPPPSWAFESEVAAMPPWVRGVGGRVPRAPRRRQLLRLASRAPLSRSCCPARPPSCTNAPPAQGPS